MSAIFRAPCLSRNGEHIDVDLMTAGRFTQHRPASANEGLGRKLLAARTGSTSEAGREIRMTVVNIRDTLIAWYLRVRTDQRDRAVPLG